MPLTRLIEALKDRRAYPHRPKTVHVLQTHISAVFIADDLVFKIKKPVDFGFLDFSDLDKRKYYCEEEARLNARLCPDIYLGVVPITDNGTHIEIQGNGTVVEYGVKMKRLDEDSMMNGLLDRGLVTSGDVGRIAGVLEPFYRSVRTGPRIDRYGTIPVIGLNCDENFNQTRPYIGKTISAQHFESIKGFTERVFKTGAGLFEERVRGGFIREGHGDLHSRNICITAQDVYIYDCIEFNERFRMGDVAQDIAFLSMDLDSFRYPALSRFFIDEYVRLSGDTGLGALIDFYACYHAFSRGKVMSFELGEEEIDTEEKQRAALRARAYFHLAHHYAVKETSPFLAITFGLAGTGKSRVADLLADEMDFQVIRSDEIRKEIAGIDRDEHRYGGFGDGIYSKHMTENTYNTLFDRARRLLSDNRSVILDACFLKEDERRRAREIAEETGSRFLILATTCPDDVVEKRIRRRMSQESVSDGTFEVYQRQKLLRQPLTDTEQADALGLDTTRDEQVNLRAAVGRLLLGE
ncbi:MAG: AAA family ATPase [Deltaproteobacteria bacterium]|nr:AAA family ATPase [Candidatus Zymogenaceae bacterium]